ncbi:unnamed protein product [Angiostrongylus costaricensis]|uniref:SAYSvFN domain-containing protein n=1 Tax=Angiostrongylus costaricensis TaxID=334426 RepID=A0A0R3PJC7_ANGCS|nr:unnamed protein product [Angiostrongylus costaricensis]
MSTISDRTPGNSPNFSTTSLQPKPERFNCSILMVSSMGVIQLVVQWIAVNVSSFIAQGLILFVAAYSYEWNSVHSESLTRHRRAHFDIANVLETYQPRNRTMGHLFQSVGASLDGEQTENVVLTPADPVRDQKEYEEKKKKDAEEYQKQFDKPFSC